MRNHNQRERGQALVESALVTLVFLSMFIGIIDLGQMMFVHQTLTERARDAVREAVVVEFDAEEIRNKILYGQPTAPEPTVPEDPREDPVEPKGFLGLKADMLDINRYDAGTVDDRVSLSITRPPYRFYNPMITKVLETAPIIVTLPYEGE